MDKKAFKELLQSLEDMGRHMNGQIVEGVRTVHLPEPDVTKIREATGLSQTGFANLIGVKTRTLQNWEQQRVKPTGPAKTLLRIVELNPQALFVLHQR